MRLLKMKIQRIDDGGHTHYEYPTPFYDAYKVKFGPIYESGIDTGLAGVKDRAKNDEFILIGVEDVDVGQFLEADKVIDKDHQYTTVELTQAEAVTFCDAYTAQIEKIMDMDKVITILAKVGRGETLTQIELDALNPNSSEIGINITPKVSDILLSELSK